MDEKMYEIGYVKFADMPSIDVFLAPAEMKYFNTLKVEKRQFDYCLGRYSVKKLLHEKFMPHLKLTDIEILRNFDGSPKLEIQWRTAEEMKISLSHSHRMAAAVASMQVNAIGVDIEKIEQRDESWREMCFHPDERAELTTPEKQTQAWCVKEAAVKMLGRGFSLNMWDVRFEKGKIKLYGVLRNTPQDNIVCELRNDLPGFATAVVYRRR